MLLPVHVIAIVLVVAIQLTCTGNGTEDTGKFCGYLALNACVRDLGIGSGASELMATLHQQQVTDMSTIKQAAESFGLEANAYWITQENAIHLSSQFRALQPLPRGVGWTVNGDADSSGSVGHFFVVTGVSETGVVYGYDAHNYATLEIAPTNGSEVSVLFLGKQMGFVESVGFRVTNSVASLFSSVYGLLVLAGLYVYCFIGGARIVRVVRLGLNTPRKTVLKFVITSSVFGIATLLVFSTMTYWHDENPLTPHFGFERSVYSLGEVSIGEVKSISVKLRNFGDAAIDIDEVAGDCGCMMFHETKQRIPPHSSTEVSLQLVHPRLGLNSHRVVAVSGESSASCRLQFVGVNAAKLKPRSVFAGSLDHATDPITIAEFQVQDYVGPELSNVEVQPLTNPSPIRISCVPCSVLANGQNVQIIIELVPDGTQRGLFCQEAIVIAGEGEEQLNLPCTICVELR
jgi:hypothetical protein